MQIWLRVHGSGSQHSQAYLGMSELVLGVINVDGAQKLLRSLLAVDELPFWNSACI